MTSPHFETAGITSPTHSSHAQSSVHPQEFEGASQLHEPEMQAGSQVMPGLQSASVAQAFSAGQGSVQPSP